MLLHSFTSRIDGRNAKVEIYEDRIEWSRSGINWKLAAWTLGASLLFQSRKQTETIPMRSVSSVSVKASGFFTELRVSTSTGTILLRTSAAEATQAKDVILSRLAA